MCKVRRGGLMATGSLRPVATHLTYLTVTSCAHGFNRLARLGASDPITPNLLMLAVSLRSLMEIHGEP